MKIAPKLFVVLFAITLVLSFTKPGSEFLGGILKPLATIFFMLFFITMLFGKEIARYDEEHHSKPSAKTQPPGVVAPSADTPASSNDSQPKPVLTSANSH